MSWVGSEVFARYWNGLDDRSSGTDDDRGRGRR